MRPPLGRPGLVQVLYMAQDAASTSRRTPAPAGEQQIDKAVFRVDRSTARGYLGCGPGGRDCGSCTPVTPSKRRRNVPRSKPPASAPILEPFSQRKRLIDQHEAPFVGARYSMSPKRTTASCRTPRRRTEIVVVGGAEFDLRAHAAPLMPSWSLTRSISAPQAASFSSMRS